MEEKRRDSDDSVLKPSKPTNPVPETVPTTGPTISPVSFSALFRFSTRFELFLNFIGIVAAAGAGAAQPLMSLFFGNLLQDFISFTTAINRAHAGDPEAEAGLAAAAVQLRKSASKDASHLVFLGLGVGVGTYIFMTIWVYTGEQNAKRVRENYLRAILRQDVQFFDNVGAGEITTRIQTDTHLVLQATSEKNALVASFLAAFVTGYALAYAKSWRLALAMTSLLPFIAVSSGTMNKVVAKATQESSEHAAAGGTLAEEVISTIRTAQAFGTQQTLARLYDVYINRSLAVDSKAAAWQGGGMSAFMFAHYSGYALAFFFGTILINGGHASPGDVVTVFMAIFIGSFSLALMATELQSVMAGRGAAAKLFATIDRIPDIDSANPGGLQPKQVDGEIVLEHVQFSYPSRQDVTVFEDLSITFEAGRSAALVGASGSGKSTVVSLVERFYDPLSGVVKLDGVDVKDLNLKWLRSQLGLVSQEPVLFSTTIKQNVAHGLINTKYERSSEEEKFALIKEACIKANADGFISKLPLGYDTLVGERGFLLSGGQKQRIAIARAIVSDPRILLLDEATSALDTQSEGIVQDALDKAAAGRTTIIIAHRLSTIQNVDVIYVMGDGRILEQGSHSELLRANGAYAQLVQAQQLRQALGPSEGRELPDDDDSQEDQADNRLDRKYTNHSLASETRQQQQQQQQQQEIPEHIKRGHSLAYLFRRMGRLNRDQWPKYLVGSIFAIMSGCAYPAFGIVYAHGINGFSAIDAHERRKEGNRNALWFFVIGLITATTIGLQNFLFSSAAAKLVAKVRSLGYRAILRQDIAFFDEAENSTGALTAGLSDNPQKIKGLAGITLATLVQSCSTLVAGSAIGLAYYWKIGLVAIACMPFMVSVGYIRLRVVILKDKANKKAYAESARVACEAAASIRTVAALTREDDCCNQYSASLEVPLQQSRRSSIWSHLLYALAQSVVYFVIGLIFWYGSTLVSRQEVTMLQFVVVVMSSTLGAMQAGNIFMFAPDMSSASTAASDVINLLDARPEIDAESTDGRIVSPEKLEGRVLFDNVRFHYPTRPSITVLQGLTLRVEPGQYVALVGASGSGKSTIVQLLERFYDPTSGAVYFDGEQVAELNVQEYRKQIALVSQEPTLYAGSIRFNILLGAIKPEAEVTMEEIENACRNANILEFIQSLPDGFDTDIGSKGSQLSGGQKQRIAIARALLRNPKLLLLDEATSALDSTSEKVVQQALDQAARGRTTIAIAHRLSSIQNADVIYFIKEGRISESGTHDQLLSQRGDYYEYVKLQDMSKK